MCQSQMDDAESKCSQPYDADDRSWNQILTMINYSLPFLWKIILKTININRLQFEDMTKCNIIFTELYYFLECYWSGCRPIENSKPKWLNPLESMNACYWSITLERGESKHPQRYGTARKVLKNLLRLHRSEGKHAPLGACHPAPPADSTARLVVTQ